MRSTSSSSKFSRLILPLCAMLFGLAAISDAFADTAVLHSFRGTDGAFPTSLIYNRIAGAFYGTASKGGHFFSGDCSEGCGTVFEWKPNIGGQGGGFRTIYKFRGGSLGYYPVGGLRFDAQGNLYGIAGRACSNKPCFPPIRGIAFRLARPKPPALEWRYEVLHGFTTGDGDPGALALDLPARPGDAAGTLYVETLRVSTRGPCGRVIKFAPGATFPWKATEIVELPRTGGPSGCTSAPGGLSFDQTGAIYDVHHDALFLLLRPTSPGGSWTRRRIMVSYSLSGGLLQRDGYLYGAHYYGTHYDEGVCADFGCGGIFRARSDGTHQETLHAFLGPEEHDGSLPIGNLTFGSDGNLYGVTKEGGVGTTYRQGLGTIFSLLPPKGPGEPWSEKVLHMFTQRPGPDGGHFPSSGLVFLGPRIFYGTTRNGGFKSGRLCAARDLWGHPSGCGVLYRGSLE